MPRYSTMTGGSGAALPLRRFLLSLLSNQRLVDVGNDTCRERGRNPVKPLQNSQENPPFPILSMAGRSPSVRIEGSSEPRCLCQIPAWLPTSPPCPSPQPTREAPTSSSDGGFDQRVQLLVAADGQLQVPGRDPLHLEILGRVPGQLQHLREGRRSWERPGRAGQGAAEGGGPTSAVRYSRMAALYTAAVAPTRPWLVVRVFRCLWMRPTGNWGAISNLVNTHSPYHVHIYSLHCCSGLQLSKQITTQFIDY